MKSGFHLFIDKNLFSENCLDLSSYKVNLFKNWNILLQYILLQNNNKKKIQ